MSPTVKSRFVWLLGILLIVTSIAFAWVAFGLAFVMPEQRLIGRFGGTILALALSGAAVWMRVLCFIKSGYSEHQRVIDALAIRLYFIGGGTFIAGFWLFWMNP